MKKSPLNLTDSTLSPSYSTEVFSNFPPGTFITALPNIFYIMGVYGKNMGPIGEILGGIAGLFITVKGVETVTKGLDSTESSSDSTDGDKDDGE